MASINKLLYTSLVFLSILSGAPACTQNAETGYRQPASSQKSVPSDQDEPSVQKPMDYDSILNGVQSQRKIFQQRYNSASLEDKLNILDESREFVFNSLVDNIFPAWYGTTWDFYGKTERPKEGGIACGVFVTRMLGDAGFVMDEVSMGSEIYSNIRKNLALDGGEKIFTNVQAGNKINQVLDFIKEKGKGIYLVGLDCHGGFIVNDGKNALKFVHSSYYDPPRSVVSENAAGYNPFYNSKYIEVTKLFGDKMMEKWIKGEKFQHIHRYGH